MWRCNRTAQIYKLLHVVSFSQGTKNQYLEQKFVKSVSTNDAIVFARFKSTASQRSFRKVNTNGHKDRSNGVRTTQAPSNNTAMASELMVFREHVDSGRYMEVISTWRGLMSNNLLSPLDVRNVAQSLLQASRSKEMPPEHLQQRLDFFISKYKDGSLPTTRGTVLRVLATYRTLKDYEGGISFWNWVVDHRAENLALADFGAAIELAAASGQSLETCEDIYARALAARRVDFNEYLLSPGSVLSQPDTPTMAKGTSLGLLQGIIFARFLHGDWNAAYLGLDTALKLHPTQMMPRFLELFAYNRSVTEAVEVLRAICQSGNRPSAKSVAILLHNASKYQRKEPEKAPLLALEIIRLSILTSANLNVNHLTKFIQISLDTIPSPQELEEDQRNAARELASDMISASISLFVSLHIYPSSETVFKILVAANRTGDPELTRRALLAFSEIGEQLTPDMVKNLILVSSTRGSTKEDLVSVWDSLRSYSMEFASHREPWEGLAMASAHLNDPVIFTEALKRDIFMNEDSKASYTELLTEAMESKDIGRNTQAKSSPSSVGSFRDLQHANSLLNHLQRIKEMVDKGDITSSSSIIGDFNSSYPEEWYKSLYFELQIEPFQSSTINGKTEKEAKYSKISTEESAKPLEATETGGLEEVEPGKSALASNEHSLSEIRYENWKCITKLLLHASALEEGKSSLCSESPPSLTGGPAQHRPAQETGYLLQRKRLQTETDWRNEVLSLRQLKPVK